MPTPYFKTEVLGVEQMARFGATHKFIVKYDDINDLAATSQTTVLFSGEAGQFCQYVGHRIRTNFDGGATSELTAKLGWNYASLTDDDDGFLAATSIHEDGTEIPYTPLIVADVDASTVDNTYGQQENDVITSLRTKLNTVLKALGKTFSEAWGLELVLTATGANFTALTQGEVWFYVKIIDLKKI